MIAARWRSSENLAAETNGQGRCRTSSMEEDLIWTLLGRKHWYLQGYPNVVAVEWDVVPGHPMWGKGDLVLASADHCRVMVVEIKRDTGKHRTRKIRKLQRQMNVYQKVWQTWYPTARVEACGFYCGRNGAELVLRNQAMTRHRVPVNTNTCSTQ